MKQPLRVVASRTAWLVACTMASAGYAAADTLEANADAARAGSGTTATPAATATPATPETTAATSTTAATATAVTGIYVFRNDPGGNATPIDVLIDGAAAGRTTSMSHVFKPVAPGKHLVASMGGDRDTLEVTVLPGALTYVWQELKPTYRSAPRTVLRLVDDAQGKRAVAQTRLVAAP